MARPTNDEKLRSVHDEAIREFDRIIGVMQPERQQCLKDRRFCDIPGAQWEGALGEQFQNKPMFEVNKVHLSVLRIENEYRNNRITADFVSRDGTRDDELADTCDGLFRADEQDSIANEAYDNAFSEGLRGGFGAWRLRTEYEYPDDETDTRQRIRIEPIFEADSCVFFDIDASRQDKKDAKHCFVLVPMSYESYKDTYNDSPSSWDREVTASEFDWATPDKVYIAEYYKVVDSGKTVLFFNGINGEVKRYDKKEYDEDEELQEELEATGYKLVQSKRIPQKRVHKYIMSGGKVLEDCGYIAGERIPIAPFYGKRWFVDGVERCMGHVRLARDPQRLKNMQLSKLAEISAYSSIEKPIFIPEQIAGHQVMWQEDNIKQYPYLLVNPITDAEGQVMPSGPLAYTKPPQIPQALATLLQITETDMADILGNPQNADKMVSNISSKTVELIQTRIDLQAYIYMSNFAKSVQCGGEIWLSMAKEVYVEDKRKMKTVGVNGEPGTVEIKKPTLGENDEVKYSNDLAEAKMDVFVEVGPSFNTQRESMTRSITSLMGVVQDPETLQVLQSLMIMNLEGEGLKDVREYFRRRLVSMGTLPPSEEDKKRLEEAEANRPPDPNTQLAEAMSREASAKAEKALAETGQVTANTELTHAKTLETLAGIDAMERENAIRTIQAFMQQNGIRPTEIGAMEGQ